MTTRDSQHKGIDEYLASLKASPRFGRQIVHHEEMPGQDAVFGKLPTPLPEVLEQCLRELGITNLYRHQTDAIDLLRQGRHVMVATPTASGKSLIYNLPVIERIINEPEACALYLFPLKALAQDQLRAVDELTASMPAKTRPRAAIYDGDTSAYRRSKLRKKPPHILISNPDMLHLSLLGYHDSWAGFWAGLRFVVIDEAHTYRGVFGSHMAWVLRRLRRICTLYGADPAFLLSSATIGNPGELARDLLGVDAEVITDTGAPRGTRHFVFMNPEDSAAYAASQLLEAGLKRGLRSIVYTQSRKFTELVSMWTKSRLGPSSPKLTAYRSGFLPEERREIEQKLTSGELLGVVSTSALELGIDIGALDLCILVGYPGTIMQTWQRSGRVGRQLRDSLTVLIAQEDALDQHFMRTPADFFNREVEAAVLNPANQTIAAKHLVCAAAEHPIAVDDKFMTADAAFSRRIEILSADGSVLLSADGKRWLTNRKYPHREISLRGSGTSFTIMSIGKKEPIGEIDGIRSQRECHPGAVYLHRGQTWVILDLDLDRHIVTATRKNVNYFTRTMGEKETEILAVHDSCTRQNITAHYGSLRVTDRVTGFQRRLVSGHRLLSTEKLDLPPIVFETEGIWLEIPEWLQKVIEKRKIHFMGGIHAVEHSIIGMFPLRVLCDRNDVGGIAYPWHPQLAKPAIFIYDGYPGGVGLCRHAFTQIEELLKITLNTIASCECETGCPSCVHSPKCGSGNRPIDKESARLIIEGLLSGDEGVIPADSTEENRQPLPIADLPIPSGVRVTERETISPSPPTISTAEKLPAKYGVFDLETKLSAAEVGGWHRAERMGISVAVLYEAAEDRFLTFLEHEIDELVNRLAALDLVVGFNNRRFDNRVLSAYTDFDLHTLPTMDILEVVKDRLGYRLSLDHLARETLGAKKSGNGLQALKWFREGRMEELIDYCRKDVEITRDLFLFGVNNRYLLFRNKAGSLVRCPVKMLPSLPTGKG